MGTQPPAAPTSPRTLRIVVASPGDVQAERDLLPGVLEELNRGIAATLGLHLELHRWETDAYPGFHPEGPQGLIDKTLRIEDSDVLIGIFWKRFGTPTKKARSGTEHEFLSACQAWRKHGRPQIMVYFNEAPYTPKSSQETAQWGMVLDFKRDFPKEGLWWPYKGKTQFEKLVRNHLTQFLRQTFPASPAAPPTGLGTDLLPHGHQDLGSAGVMKSSGPEPVPSVPRVFMSYSHDSQAHKDWVRGLATRLRQAGIDVVLDQWDLHPGMDITRFMEDGITHSDRVVVVCTEPYVEKADSGTGGAGYERMIVSAEMTRDLGTTKFIPVIRQPSGEPRLPRCLGARMYVDFRLDAGFDASLQHLVEEIHGHPRLPKPPLGPNPFAAISSPVGDTDLGVPAEPFSLPALPGGPKRALTFSGFVYEKWTHAMKPDGVGELVTSGEICERHSDPKTGLRKTPYKHLEAFMGALARSSIPSPVAAWLVVCRRPASARVVCQITAHFFLEAPPPAMVLLVGGPEDDPAVAERTLAQVAERLLRLPGVNEVPC